jgi:hypothetical protein
LLVPAITLTCTMISIHVVGCRAVLSITSNAQNVGQQCKVVEPVSISVARIDFSSEQSNRIACETVC